MMLHKAGIFVIAMAAASPALSPTLPPSAQAEEQKAHCAITAAPPIALGLEQVKRCFSEDGTEIALEGQSLPEPISTAPVTKPDCEFNSRLYRSPLFKDSAPNSYQELQFTDGTAAGAIDLTEYRRGQAVWTAHGSFTCSNGASICRVNFPLMLREPVELPYETIDSTDISPEMVVVPALRQEVYQSEQYAVMQGKAYGGLVADLLNGFKLKDDELTLPYNVYTYADCKDSP